MISTEEAKKLSEIELMEYVKNQLLPAKAHQKLVKVLLENNGIEYNRNDVWALAEIERANYVYPDHVHIWFIDLFNGYRKSIFSDGRGIYYYGDHILVKMNNIDENYLYLVKLQKNTGKPSYVDPNLNFDFNYPIWLHDSKINMVKTNLKSATRVRDFKSYRLCHQFIISGPPGAGKSHFIEKQLIPAIVNEKNYHLEDYYERVVFSDSMVNEDLFGSYVPTQESKTGKSDNNKNENDENEKEVNTTADQIKYEFVPGPLINILIKAYANPRNNYVFIMEEINRGNTFDILGDLFVLLDRNHKKESKYRISISIELQKYINSELHRDYNTYVEKTKKSFIEEEKELKEEDIEKEVWFRYNKMPVKISKLYIPSNLFIIATMNNSDSGVHYVDASLRRRFDMMYIDKEGIIFGAQSLLDILECNYKPYSEELDGRDEDHMAQIVPDGPNMNDKYYKLIREINGKFKDTPERKISSHYITDAPNSTEAKVMLNTFIYLAQNVYKNKSFGKYEFDDELINIKEEETTFNKILDAYKSNSIKIEKPNEEMSGQSSEGGTE